MSVILDPALLPSLARLQLVSRRRAGGARGGNLRHRRLGLSLDFADHRAYADGDDLRFLDWQVLARHDLPYIRRFHDEQALRVRLLLDRSRSMGFGAKDKLALARTLAAGLAFVALAQGSVVSIHAFAARAEPPLGPLRGRARLHDVLGYLEGIEAEGESDLEPVARAVTGPGTAGLTVVLSDFLQPRGFEAALKRLDHAGHAVFVLRVVAPEEERPEAAGEVTLVDAETGEQLSLTLSPGLVDLYRRLDQGLADRLAAAAKRAQGGSARVGTDADPRRVFLGDLKQAGLLR